MPGMFHDGLDPDPASKYISDVGITCNDQYHTRPLERPPMDTLLRPPAIPRDQGLMSSTWYLAKAPLKGLVQVQVCRDKEQSHRPCLGLLLLYSDHDIESIGQVRWDYGFKSFLSLFMLYTVPSMDESTVKDIRSERPGPGLDEECDGQQKLPENGIIAWWFSHLGDRIITYND